MLIAQEQTTEEAPKTGLVEREKITVNQATEIVQEGTFWLTPVKDDESGTAEETILTLVGKEKIYAIGERTPGRRLMKPGDKICFYATARGVMAHAEIVSHPENKPNPAVRHPEDFPWTFRLSDVHLYVDNPVVVDAALRQTLDAFRGRDISKAWAWFVQATHKLTSHDFSLLIRST